MATLEPTFETQTFAIEEANVDVASTHVNIGGTAYRPAVDTARFHDAVKLLNTRGMNPDDGLLTGIFVNQSDGGVTTQVSTEGNKNLPVNDANRIHRIITVGLPRNYPTPTVEYPEQTLYVAQEEIHKKVRRGFAEAFASSWVPRRQRKIASGIAVLAVGLGLGGGAVDGVRSEDARRGAITGMAIMGLGLAAAAGTGARSGSATRRWVDKNYQKPNFGLDKGPDVFQAPIVYLTNK